ncbi:FAD-binding protein [Nocardia cyriacigeorgica]|uniref:FAD-binding oxidoreductase n=1 Tax=Nocardia cyriacigeorgica TaxID=135487 RepID=UPI0018958242|nr:FAD-linked oxidase C-terminal domain-containing protein [Nocardia cyriacigeorgica]MBF6101175.1 FAD-binding protein [Nocardia cyriacigeorgica]MBF6160588.1 FAD-binding protein [Nocardia cyriacigeorgica]MBF6199645.1 FAD-binding protein [Nocardia cyriacigeorgica]MBF6320055.1 FAD-binding protein [Nocardia cyriacigeorgica]MBF6517085.1 FAD-binding protein [Nocardia cyriacigeorgica]
MTGTELTGPAVVGRAITDELIRLLPPGRVLTDPEVTAGLAHDQAIWAPVGTPVAVVRARSTEEVRHVVRTCSAHGAPLVARGAGTGLCGGANAIDGGVVLSLEAMDSILEIDPLERIAVVQPGVVNDDLRRQVAAHGLWYPPDPASSPWSTIGGNAATNAGGVCCLKYGVTRDYVIAAEIVTGTGEVVRLGRRTAKGVAGYDLLGLIVGSEGTLGVITEITVKLRPLPAGSVTVVGAFGSVTEAGAAVRAARTLGLQPAALELVDRHCLRAVDEWKNMGLTAEGNALLLARFDDAESVAAAHAERMVDCFTAAGATFAERSETAEEAELLFTARRLAFPALERLGPVLTEDVCVPIGAVPEMLARIDRIATRHNVVIANIAHVGDGNLHPLLLLDPSDTALRARAQQAFEDIMTEAIELGGTITGEHGVGLLKQQGLNRELAPAVLAMHRAVKQALDPAGILNPGKIFE